MEEEIKNEEITQSEVVQTTQTTDETTEEETKVVEERYVDIDLYINEVHYVGRVRIDEDGVFLLDDGLLKTINENDTNVYHHGRQVTNVLSAILGRAHHDAFEKYDDEKYIENYIKCDYSGWYGEEGEMVELENGDYCFRRLAIEWNDEYYYRWECSEHSIRRSDGDEDYIWAPDTYWGDRPYCECCGCYIEDDSDYYGNGECVYCHEDDESVIEDYGISHDHEPVLFGDYKDERTFAGLGFELEVDCDYENQHNNEETASNLCSACDLAEDEMRYAHDGSLDNGFECISQPHTVKAFWEKQNSWRKMLAYLSRNGYKSHDAGTCGLHVHVSRNMFGSSQSEQERAIAKVYTFFDENWEDIVKISRRRDFGYCEKNRPYGSDVESSKNKYETWTKSMKKSVARGHYVALNNANCRTFEYRLGRGTLNAWSFFAWIDFVITITKNARRINIEKVCSNDLLSWLGGIKESTAKYIYKRGAFRKEMLALFPNIEWETDLTDSSES